MVSHICQVRGLGVDDELYHRGMSSPWYTYQIELAIEYELRFRRDKTLSTERIVSASSRVAWGDYDNDGDDDIMTNGPLLYANNGDGTFEDLTDLLVFTTESTSGGVWGDYNNDGCLDYFGQGYADVLFMNTCNANGQGYSLVDVTAESGSTTFKQNETVMVMDLKKYLQPRALRGLISTTTVGLISTYQL